MIFDIEAFSEAKNSDKGNEDFYGYNDNTIVISDGATDKSGQLYDGKTGGYLLSRLVVEECLNTDLNGFELIGHLNKKASKLYEKINTQALKDVNYRFYATIVCLRIIDNKIIVTLVGDSGFRIDGISYYQEKTVDYLLSGIRAEYINKTGDIENSREFILPLLKRQLTYTNNESHPLGYGMLDGISVPEKFIKIYEFSLDEIKIVELFTDGYMAQPEKIGKIKYWEDSYQTVEKTDPNKFLKYKSTKTKDDRTILIATKK